MTEDSLIWDNFRKGDNNALSKIYHDNIRLLFRYGMKFSHDNELIKDTIQDLFVDLLRTRSKLGSTDNITFYLIKAMKRRLVQNYRKMVTQNKNEVELGPEPLIVYSTEEIIIADEELKQKNWRIRQGLKEISPRQREILFYRFTCNFDYDQICDIMSLKYDSARKQVFRAIKALKDSLNEGEI